jgi:hypothetical protein
MAANLGEEQKEKLFTEVLNDISENGKSLFASLKGRMSSQTFYDYLDRSEERSKRYARATELRAEIMAEETLNIADAVGDDIIVTEDGREIVNNNVINRDRLRVETRKWLMAKLYPKKYGDKIGLEHSGSIETDPPVFVFKKLNPDGK